MSKYILLKVEDIEKEIKQALERKEYLIKISGSDARDQANINKGIGIVLTNLLTNKHLDLSEEAISKKAYDYAYDLPDSFYEDNNIIDGCKKSYKQAIKDIIL